MGNSTRAIATADEKPQHFSVRFINTTTQDVTIGVQWTNTTANWVAVDNFHLIYEGTPSPWPSSSFLGRGRSLHPQSTALIRVNRAIRVRFSSSQFFDHELHDLYEFFLKPRKWLWPLTFVLWLSGGARGRWNRTKRPGSKAVNRCDSHRLSGAGCVYIGQVTHFLSLFFP